MGCKLLPHILQSPALMIGIKRWLSAQLARHLAATKVTDQHTVPCGWFRSIDSRPAVLDDCTPMKSILAVPLLAKLAHHWRIRVGDSQGSTSSSSAGLESILGAIAVEHMEQSCTVVWHHEQPSVVIQTPPWSNGSQVRGSDNTHQALRC